MARQALPKDTELHSRYRVDTVLGAGGFGITYVGQDLHLNRAVAIKEYFPTEFALREGHYSVRSLDTGNKQFFALGRTWFLREARTLAKYHHPNIVGVMDHFEENNTAYMILRFEEGQSLSRWLRSLGRAPTQFEVDGFMLPILSALETMHKNNDLHRDVAMDNIILRPEGDPVLIDFGSARQAIGAHSRSIDAVVKFGYSPPEQYSVDAKLQGPWSDIYALAATLHLAITGRLPPDAPGRQLDDNYERLADSGVQGYRIGLLEGIDWGLALRPSERPPTISEWRRTLLKTSDEPLDEDPVELLGRPSQPARLGLRTTAPATTAHDSGPTEAAGTVFVAPTRHRPGTAAASVARGGADGAPSGLASTPRPIAGSARHPSARLTSTPTGRATPSRSARPATAHARSQGAPAGDDAAVEDAEDLADGLAPRGPTLLGQPWLDALLLAFAAVCMFVFFRVSGAPSASGTTVFTPQQAALVGGYGLALAAFVARHLYLGQPERARPRAALAMGLLWLPTVLLSVFALPLFGLAVAVGRAIRPWHATALNIAGGLHIAAGVLLIMLTLRDSPMFVLATGVSLIVIGFLVLLSARAAFDANS